MKYKYTAKKMRENLFLLNIFCTVSIANATRSLGSIQTLFLGITKIALIAFISVSVIDFMSKSSYKIYKLQCIVVPSMIYFVLRSLVKNYGFSLGSYLIAIGLYFSCVIFFQYEKSYDMMLNACIAGGYGLIFYLIYAYGGVTRFLKSIQSSVIENVIVQKNILAYIMAIVVLICVYRIVYEKKNMYLLIVVLPIIVAVGTGSRRGLIAIVVSMITLIVLKDFNFKMLLNIMLAIILLMIGFSILHKSNLGYVTERINSLFSVFLNTDGISNSDQGRMNMINYGWNMFKENPLFGNGADAFKHLSGFNKYSHNNFIELLANFGAIGFILFYYMYVIIIKELFLIAKKGDTFSKFLLTYFIMRVISDYGNVSYYDRFNYIMIAVGVSYILKKRGIGCVKKKEY